MKPFLSYILILTFCLPQVGTTLFLNALKGKVKQDVKAQIHAGLSSEDLISFVFSEEESNNLEWEHEREFFYAGMMYDVVKKISRSDGQLEYHVYADNKESQIKKTIAHTVDQKMNHHPAQSQTLDALSSFMQTLICVESNFSREVNDHNSLYNFTYSKKREDAHLSILSPPPEFLLS